MCQYWLCDVSLMGWVLRHYLLMVWYWLQVFVGGTPREVDISKRTGTTAWREAIDFGKHHERTAAVSYFAANWTCLGQSRKWTKKWAYYAYYYRCVRSTIWSNKRRLAARVIHRIVSRKYKRITPATAVAGLNIKSWVWLNTSYVPYCLLLSAVFQVPSHALFCRFLLSFVHYFRILFATPLWIWRIYTVSVSVYFWTGCVDGRNSIVLTMYSKSLHMLATCEVSWNRSPSASLPDGGTKSAESDEHKRNIILDIVFL